MGLEPRRFGEVLGFWASGCWRWQGGTQLKSRNVEESDEDEDDLEDSEHDEDQQEDAEEDDVHDVPRRERCIFSIFTCIHVYGTPHTPALPMYI